MIMTLAFDYWRPNIPRTLQYAYNSSLAAIIFRKTKGKETARSNRHILKYLEKFYWLLHKKLVQPFDYKKVAQLELDWWYVDRYPNQSDMTRAQAFTKHGEAFYGLPATDLQEYSQKRAEAMELLRDYHHDTTYNVDWEKMERLLRESYQSLQGHLRRANHSI
jgi:hypothetical protein